MRFPLTAASLAAACAVSHVSAAEPAIVSRLTEALSERLIEGCRAFARDNSLAVAIAVVDDRLALVGYRRMDGVRQGAADLALEKAESAAAWQWPTRNNQDAVEAGRLAFVFAPHVSTVRGGVPLFTTDGFPIGAIGVSGAPAPQDEQCAEAGVRAARLRFAATDK